MNPYTISWVFFGLIALAFVALWFAEGPRKPRCPICHTNHKERHL